MQLPPLACWLHWLHQICQASPTIRSQYFLYLSVTQTSWSCETVESRCYSLKEASVSPTTLDTDYRHNYMIIIVTENIFFSFWSEDFMLNVTETNWEIHSSTREREVTHVWSFSRMFPLFSTRVRCSGYVRNLKSAVPKIDWKCRVIYILVLG